MTMDSRFAPLKCAQLLFDEHGGCLWGTMTERGYGDSEQLDWARMASKNAVEPLPANKEAELLAVLHDLHHLGLVERKTCVDQHDSTKYAVMWRRCLAAAGLVGAFGSTVALVGLDAGSRAGLPNNITNVKRNGEPSVASSATTVAASGSTSEAIQAGSSMVDASPVDTPRCRYTSSLRADDASLSWAARSALAGAQRRCASTSAVPSAKSGMAASGAARDPLASQGDAPPAKALLANEPSVDYNGDTSPAADVVAPASPASSPSPHAMPGPSGPCSGLPLLRAAWCRVKVCAANQLHPECRQPYEASLP